MSLTEQQRSELERLGWRPGTFAGSTMYEKLICCDDGIERPCAITVVSATGEIEGIGGPVEGILELVAVLGITPPGYRLVPEAMVEALTIMAEGCPTHPGYRAKREPTTDCPMCLMMWGARQRLRQQMGGNAGG